MRKIWLLVLLVTFLAIGAVLADGPGPTFTHTGAAPLNTTWTHGYNTYFEFKVSSLPSGDSIKINFRDDGAGSQLIAVVDPYSTLTIYAVSSGTGYSLGYWNPIALNVPIQIFAYGNNVDVFQYDTHKLEVTNPYPVTGDTGLVQALNGGSVADIKVYPYTEEDLDDNYWYYTTYVPVAKSGSGGATTGGQAFSTAAHPGLKGVLIDYSELSTQGSINDFKVDGPFNLTGWGAGGQTQICITATMHLSWMRGICEIYFGGQWYPASLGQSGYKRPAGSTQYANWKLGSWTYSWNIPDGSVTGYIAITLVIDRDIESYTFTKPLDPSRTSYLENTIDYMQSTENVTAPVLTEFGAGSVYAWDNTQGNAERDFVHAAYDGVIHDIVPVTLDDCFSQYSDNGETGCNAYRQASNYYMIPAAEFENMQVVSLLTDTGVLIKYLVYDAYNYVSIGADVSSGCVLGQAFETEVLTGDLQGVDNTYLTILMAYDYAQGSVYDLLPELTEEPTTNLVCDPNANNGSQLPTCFTANSTLISGNGEVASWTLVNATADTVNNTGVFIKPSGYIQQNLSNLDANINYTIHIVASGQGRLDLTLGNTHKTIYVENELTSPQNYYVVASPAVVSALYTLRVTAFENNTSDVRIGKVCIYIGEITNPPSSTCYFSNHNFSNQLQTWFYTNPIQPDYDGIWLGHNGSLSQLVELLPTNEGADMDYTFTVNFGQWENETAPTTGELVVSWDSVYETMTIPDVGYELISTSAAAASFEFTVSDTTKDDWQVVADFDGDTTARIKIRSLCIQTSDGSNFPGTPIPPSTTRPPTQTTGECSAVTEPESGLNVWAWIKWLGNSINKDFRCWLDPKINILLQETTNIRAELAQMIVFFLQVLDLLIEFSKMLVIWAISGLLNLLESFLDRTNPLRELGNLVWELFKQTVEIVSQQIANLFTSYETIRNAWETATPIVIPPLDCGTDPTLPFCATVWAMDNTIFAEGQPPLIIIYLVIGIIAIHVFIWMIRTIKEFLNDTPQVL